MFHGLQEIVDETDRYIDNLRLQRVNAALLTSSLPKHLRKCVPAKTALPATLSIFSSLRDSTPGMHRYQRNDVRT